MKESEKNISDTGLGMYSVLERAAQEIERLKKASINPKSRYWKPVKKQDNESSKVGVQYREFSGDNPRVTFDEWNEAYEHFCNQTVNTKGQEVNRKALKKYREPWMKQFSYGKSKSINE